MGLTQKIMVSCSSTAYCSNIGLMITGLASGAMYQFKKRNQKDDQAMSYQSQPMRFDPGYGWLMLTCETKDAAEWRKANKDRAWLYNPWTGVERHPDEIGRDVFGVNIVPEQ